MRNIFSGKKKFAAIAAAVALTMGIGFSGTLQANAYTIDQAATLEARTPDSLETMTRQGYRTEGGMVNPNFEDGNAIPRNQYGGPWSFTHQDELPGGAATVGEYSSYQVVQVTDAVEGMGKQAGLGDKITTALEITINKDNQQTLADSLTYSTFDDMMYGEVNQEAFYFTAWVKADQDMWFDVGISYGAAEGHAQVYWDLGRRFFVPAGTWTQIGLDENGNYLPFRSRVLTTGFMRGTGSDPTAENCNSATAETNANETIGDTKIGQYYRDGWGQAWACIRIYAYAGETYGTDGIGIPASNHGLSAGDKYLFTGANFWNQSAQPPVIEQKVESITLDKTEAALKEGEEVQLTATVAPDNAADKSIYWYSDDEAIATVDQTGKVTAIKEGSATIYAEANDGNGAMATCTVTVTKASTETPITSDTEVSVSQGTTSSEKTSGGCGSIVGFGSVGTVSLLGAAFMLGCKKNRRN